MGDLRNGEIAEIRSAFVVRDIHEKHRSSILRTNDRVVADALQQR
jgi:hypothetical protein